MLGKKAIARGGGGKSPKSRLKLASRCIQVLSSACIHAQVFIDALSEPLGYHVAPESTASSPDIPPPTWPIRSSKVELGSEKRARLEMQLGRRRSEACRLRITFCTTKLYTRYISSPP